MKTSRQRSLERRTSMFEKIHETMLHKGIDASDAINYSKREWNQTFGTKIKSKSSLIGQKKLLFQIKTRQEQVTRAYFKKREITSKSFQKDIKRETKALFATLKPKTNRKWRTHLRALKARGVYDLTKTKSLRSVITKAKLKKSVFYVKAIDKKDFDKQIGILKKTYKFKEGDLKILWSKPQYYNEFKEADKYVKEANRD